MHLPFLLLSGLTAPRSFYLSFFDSWYNLHCLSWKSWLTFAPQAILYSYFSMPKCKCYLRRGFYSFFGLILLDCTFWLVNVLLWPNRCILMASSFSKFEHLSSFTWAWLLNFLFLSYLHLSFGFILSQRSWPLYRILVLKITNSRKFRGCISKYFVFLFNKLENRVDDLTISLLVVLTPSVLEMLMLMQR